MFFISICSMKSNTGNRIFDSQISCGTFHLPDGHVVCEWLIKLIFSEETAFVKVIRPLFSAAKIRHNALLTFFFGFHCMQSLSRRLQQIRSFNLEPFHVYLKWKPSLEIAFGWIEDYGHNRQVLLHLQLRGC